jgi:hypothetical protein
MIYTKLVLNNKEFFTANPSTPEELAFTLHEERPFLDYNPNVTSKNDQLLKMFL